MTTIAEVLQLALTRHQAGDLAGAEDLYRRILDADPQNPDAWHYLGALAHQVGRHDVAVDCMLRSLATAPGNASCHSNLGLTYQALGELDKAIACYQEALRLRPDYGEAHNNLGNALANLGRMEEAETHLREAVRLLADRADAHNNLGGVQQLQRKFGEAIASYEQALRCQPDYAEAHANLGAALLAQGNLDRAQTELVNALELAPDHADARKSLCVVLHSAGKMDQAIACYEEAARRSPTDAGLVSGHLMCLNYMASLSAAELLSEHREWDRRFGNVAGAGPRPGHDRDPNRRLRIGYVSGDFKRHPVALFFEPILANHDDAQVDIVCYANVLAPDEVTGRLMALGGHWRMINTLSDVKAADLVREDRIDILVDLAGHSAGNRLGIFAHRPAPVQATYLGYPATTGLSTIDYRLTDEVADPPGEPAVHTEKLLRLPCGFSCFAPPDHSPDVGPLPARAKGYVTFGSLNGLPRLNGAVIELWAALLRALPSARLLLFRDTLRGSAKENLERQFAQHGIEPDRLELRHEFHGDTSHLPIYRDIDIALDTFPWSGHTTACEALWMGVPVITLRGPRHAGRMVASVLTHAGLPEFIADSCDAYVEKAKALSQELGHLAALRVSLRRQVEHSPLCNGRVFARQLESAFRQMWWDACKT